MDLGGRLIPQQLLLAHLHQVHNVCLVRTGQLASLTAMIHKASHMEGVPHHSSVTGGSDSAVQHLWSTQKRQLCRFAEQGRAIEASDNIAGYVKQNCTP